MNPSPNDSSDVIAPEEEARALLPQLVFDCVNGDMRAGKSVVVSASAGWVAETGACRISLQFRALGPLVPDFESLKVTFRYRSKHLSSFPETRAVDEHGHVAFDVELDAMSARTAAFLVSAEKTQAPMRQLTSAVYATEPLKSSYAADAHEAEQTLWTLDPVRPGTLHCFSADGLLRATAKYMTNDDRSVSVEFYFRGAGSLAGRHVYWALGMNNRLEREGDLALSEQTDDWSFTPVETVTFNGDRDFYFTIVRDAGEAT